MDIPRTYLADVARAALAKVGKTEVHPLEVEQAIVDLQGVQNLIARGSFDLIDTDFERACQEALAEIPLNEWLVKWRQAQKAEQETAKAAAEEAQAAVDASRAEHIARAEAEAAEAAAQVQAEAEAAAKAEAEAVATAAPAEASPALAKARGPRKAKAASAETPATSGEEQPPPALEA